MLGSLPAMHIVKTGGLASQLKFDEKYQYKAILGISIANHYFTKDRVRELAEFGVAHFEKFVVVLVDYPERWNWQLRINATSQMESEAKVALLSQSRKNGYSRELREVGLEASVPILSWHYVMGLANYARNLSILNGAFEHDDTFRTGVIDQFKQNIGSLLSNREALRGKTFSTEELNNMINYLLEEIAGFFCLHFDEGYTIDFHHHPSMDIVQRIYRNEFTKISKAMGYDWNAQGWVQVKF
jgi:tRNA-dependent cyclodipeptide synthase